MRSPALLPLVVCAASLGSLGAQSVVLPASATTAAGSTVNAFPWGTNATAWPGLRIMCLYDSTHFTAAPIPVNFPILITNVRWRANDVASSWTGGTFNNASLSLATAAVDHTLASTTWTANYGGDYATVFTGAVTVQAGTGAGVGVPGPFHVDIALPTPFLYDPTAGDLVVDTNFVNGSWTGGTQVGMDVSTNNLLARRVYSSSLYPNANGVDSAAPVVEIAWIPASPTAALATPTGAGCINAPDISSYENFATSAAFDLANSGLTLLRTGSGYIAIPGFTAYVPPSATAQVLTLADNSEAVVTLSQPMPVGLNATTTTLNVCSNGFISAGAGNTAIGTPNATTFLNSPRAFWSLCWHDFNPSIASGGRVKFEEIGGIAYVTWDGVWDAGGTSAANASTMQAQFEIAGGHVHYVYGATSVNGNGRFVGFSDAGPSTDPGSMDISAALPATYIAAQFRIVPLALGALTRPVTGTNWNLNVSQIPAAGTLGIEIFGLADPGVNDLSALGMPTCGLRATLDVLNVWVVAGSTHPYGLAIPNSAGLVGFHVFTTSAVLQPGVNAFGAITSNGIDGRIGDS